MQPVVRDPNIAGAFQMLAQVLAPDPSRAINADLARYRREGMIADTARTQADTGRIGADTARIQALTDTERGYQSAIEAMQAALGTADPGTPEGRRALAAASVGMRDGLQRGPGAVAGYSTFIDPNFAPQDDLSVIFNGTGVVPNFANTPEGQARALAAEGARNDATVAGSIQKQEIASQGIVDAATVRAQGGATTGRGPNGVSTAGRTPAAPVVSPGNAAKMDEMLDAALAQLYPDVEVSPELRRQLQVGMADAYAQTRNPTLALDQALRDAQLSVDTQEGWLWDSQSLRSGRVSNTPPSVMPSAPAAPGYDPGVQNGSNGGVLPGPTAAPTPGGQPVPVGGASGADQVARQPMPQGAVGTTGQPDGTTASRSGVRYVARGGFWWPL